MYKKIMFAFSLILLIGLFGTVGSVEAAVDETTYGWLDLRSSAANTDTLPYLPYFDDEVDLTAGGGTVGGNFGEYGALQIHLRAWNFGEDDLGFARVRIEATGTNVNKVEGAWVVRVSAVDPTLPGTSQTYPVLAEVANPAGGVVDIAVPIPDGMGFLVTLAQRGSSSISAAPFRTWVAVSDYAGGGLIIDSEDDCGDVIDRDAQASTLEAGYWSTPFGDYEGAYVQEADENQHFLNIPVGTYNIGVQDTTAGIHDEPFVAYFDQVDVPEAAYLNVDPCEAATKVVTASVDCAAQIDGADVFMNIAEGAGFLFYDLTPGVLAPTKDVDGELVFSVTPWMYWDMAIVQDEDPMNYFLIAQSFNATDREITFDLCKDGVDWVQPGMDKDWNSALLELVPPSNLDTQYFDILPEKGFPYVPEDPFGLGGGEYMSENVVLKIDPGCCGPDGAFEAKVLLDNYQRETPCCEDCECYPYNQPRPCFDDQYPDPYCGCYDDEVVAAPADLGDYLYFLDCQDGSCLDGDGEELWTGLDTDAKWWFLFVPETNPWAFGEPTLFAADGFPVDLFDLVTPALPDYATIFGDGEFYMEPAGVSALEYDVATLGGEVMHERGAWFDAAGNQLIKVLKPALVKPFQVFGDDPKDINKETGKGEILVVESVADVFPEYWLGSKMGTEWTLLANDWETTSFGPVTAIGRYSYEWWLNHGYLGDIEGHESDFNFVCCFDYGLCDQCEECEDGIQKVCEYPIVWDGGFEIYAISPTDVRMNGHWAWSWVMAMYELDLTTGINPTHYAPEANITRGEVAAFIARIMEDEGLEPLGVATVFPDVVGHWFEDEIMLLADYGIVKGDGGMFYPQRELMRDEMAKILLEAFQAIKIYAGTDYHWDENMTVQPTGEIFADVRSDFWAVAYIEELYADGLTDGCGYDDENLLYCPNDLVTRAQMAKFVISALQEEDMTQGFWPVLAPEK